MFPQFLKIPYSAACIKIKAKASSNTLKFPSLASVEKGCTLFVRLIKAENGKTESSKAEYGFGR